MFTRADPKYINVLLLLLVLGLLFSNIFYLVLKTIRLEENYDGGYGHREVSKYLKGFVISRGPLLKKACLFQNHVFSLATASCTVQIQTILDKTGRSAK